LKNIDFGSVADIYDDYVNVNFDIPFYQSIVEGTVEIFWINVRNGQGIVAPYWRWG